MSKGTRRTRPITRSMTQRLSADGASPAAALSGALRCVCGDFLVGAHDQLLQCVNCGNWLHPGCVDIGTQPSQLAQARRTFVCPFCTGDFKKRARVENHQMVKLQEVADKRPPNAAEFDMAVLLIRRQLGDGGFTPIEFPNMPMNDAIIADGVLCCKTSIEALTFSESYPIYCMNEQMQNHHKYLQGAAARHNASNRVVSMVLGNGMDPYTNLRGAITHVKALLTRGIVRPNAISTNALDVGPVDDFVHFTFIVTDDAFRGQGLAKRLLIMEMARWCARGRRRGFLNMALEKEVRGDKTVCKVSEGPRKLYTQCGFVELCERVDANGNNVWTKREEDMGRFMVNLDMTVTVRQYMQQFAQLKAPAAAAAQGPGGEKKATSIGMRLRSVLGVASRE